MLHLWTENTMLTESLKAEKKEVKRLSSMNRQLCNQFIVIDCNHHNMEIALEKQVCLLESCIDELLGKLSALDISFIRGPMRGNVYHDGYTNGQVELEDNEVWKWRRDWVVDDWHRMAQVATGDLTDSDNENISGSPHAFIFWIPSWIVSSTIGL